MSQNANMTAFPKNDPCSVSCFDFIEEIQRGL